MIYRTDLALELAQGLDEDACGIESRMIKKGEATITYIRVLDEIGEKLVGKPKGKYITLEIPPLSDSPSAPDENTETLAEEIISLLPPKGTVLVVGLGNTEITPDALGPLAASRTLATRHINEELKRVTSLTKLRSTAVLAPGVLGQTGIESAEIIEGIVNLIKPVAVIVIDALASKSLARLGCTVQICDTGISPGGGVGNRRPQINHEVLGVPVIAIGVPTIVDAATIAADLLSPSEDDYNEVRDYVAPRGAEMMVTPREIDLLVDRAARLVSMAINRALHPAYSTEALAELL
jgi:spore protease